jgi:lysophospholipase L1-like esterase
MANFPVINQRNINDICLAEGIPQAFNFSNTVSTPTNGTDLITATTFSNVGSFGLNSNFMFYPTSFTIISSRDIQISFRVDNVANRKFRGPNDQNVPNSYTRINTAIQLRANERYTIKDNIFQNFGFDPNIYVVCTDTIGTAVTISVNFFGYNLTKNSNVFASRQLLWVGDSISYGTGSTSFENVTTTNPTQSSTANQEPFAQQIKKNLINKGYDFWLTNKAQSSMTTDSIVQAIKWGYYDMSNPNLIVIMIGANDAYNLGVGGLNVSANQTIFLNNITFINNYFLKRFPNSKILWLGSTPSATNADETRIEIGRGIINTYITGLSNTNIKYYSLATAFDRTNTANYLTSDTIHPTAQNAISIAIQSFIDTTNWYN